MKTKKIDKKLIFQKSTITNLNGIIAGSDAKSYTSTPITICDRTTTTLNCTVTVCQTQCPSGITPYGCNLC